VYNALKKKKQRSIPFAGKMKRRERSGGGEILEKLFALVGEKRTHYPPP